MPLHISPNRDLAKIDALETATAVDLDALGFTVEPFAPPSAAMTGKPPQPPLLDPAEDWTTQTRRLVARRNYEV